jgi:hypothetical protein
MTARGCADQLFRCRLLGHEQALCARIRARCTGKLAALENPDRGAAVRLGATAARACGKLEPSEILATVGIGFEGALPRCAELGLPPTMDVADVAACVARAYSCGARAVVRHALPFVDRDLDLDLGKVPCPGE